jgi:hypothetical protein
MIERIDDMPDGVVGLRASGKLTRDDYREDLEPGLKEATDSGEARVVFVLTDFEGLEPGAWFEDVKTDLTAEIANRGAGRRRAECRSVHRDLGETLAETVHVHVS